MENSSYTIAQALSDIEASSFCDDRCAIKRLDDNGITTINKNTTISPSLHARLLYLVPLSVPFQL